MRPPRGWWPRAATLIVLVAIALGGASLQPVTLLTATTDGGTLLCRRLPGGFTLVFTHSMYGGDVRETWHPDGADLTRQRIVTDNAAAAEYYASDGRVARVADGFEVLAPSLTEDSLPVRVDQIGRHRLVVGGDEVSLADLVAGSARVTLRAERVPMIGWVLGAGCG